MSIGAIPPTSPLQVVSSSGSGPRLTPAVAATRYVVPGWFSGTSVTTADLPDGTFFYFPIFVSHTTTFIGIAIHVGTASDTTGTARMGIYNMDPSTRLPTSLVLDAGTVLTTTTGAKEIVISQALTANAWYYLALVSTFTGAVTPQVRGFDDTVGVVSPFGGENSSVSTVSGKVIPSVTGRAADVAGGLPSTATAPTAMSSPSLCPIVKLRIS